MDPIVAAIVAAAAAGATAGVKDVAGKAVSDAYTTLKQLIFRKSEQHPKLITAYKEVEDDPADRTSRQALSSRLEEAGVPKDTDVRKALADLLEELKKDAKAGQAAQQAGFNIDELNAENLNVQSKRVDIRRADVGNAIFTVK